MVRECAAMKRQKKEKGDNQKGGDQNRYRPFVTSCEVEI